MKTLLTASALTLITHLALADNIYGGFNSRELDTGIPTSPNVADRPMSPGGVDVSLFAFYEGDPDVPHDLRGAVRRAPMDAALTAYDQFLLGDPDSGPGVRTHAPAPMRSEQGIAATGMGDSGRS
jgi:hypothetical protein